jgi:hypothetical protein
MGGVYRGARAHRANRRRPPAFLYVSMSFSLTLSSATLTGVHVIRLAASIRCRIALPFQPCGVIHVMTAQPAAQRIKRR